MQKGKIKFFQIPIIKIELWWIYFCRHMNGCGYIPLLVKNNKDIQPILSSPWYFGKKCVPPFSCTIGVGYVFLLNNRAMWKR